MNSTFASPLGVHAMFTDIRVEPATGETRKIPVGGPIWPEFETQLDLRYRRGTRPVDVLPQRSPTPAERLNGAGSWGGYAVKHFGHFIAEQSTRFLQKTIERPDDQMIMLLPPGMSARSVPGWMRGVMEWFGIQASQVRWIERTPLEVAELHAFGQAENLDLGPSETYLDMLDRHCTAQHGLLPDRHAETVYVSRGGVLGSKLGGEEYLEQQLRAHGVTVIRPERLPLLEQLAYYRGANNLIFSEGSAAHCRQLLGRVRQRISVLVRRKGSAFGKTLLAPRCDNLQVADTLLGNVFFSFDARRRVPHSNRGFAFVSQEKLLDFFALQGIDLSATWDSDAFDAAQEEDLVEWGRRLCSVNAAAPVAERIKLMQGGLYAIGQARFASRLARIAKMYDQKWQERHAAQ